MRKLLLPLFLTFAPPLAFASGAELCSDGKTKTFSEAFALRSAAPLTADEKRGLVGLLRRYSTWTKADEETVPASFTSTATLIVDGSLVAARETASEAKNTTHPAFKSAAAFLDAAYAPFDAHNPDDMRLATLLEEGVQRRSTAIKKLGKLAQKPGVTQYISATIYNEPTSLKLAMSVMCGHLDKPSIQRVIKASEGLELK